MEMLFQPVDVPILIYILMQKQNIKIKIIATKQRFSKYVIISYDDISTIKLPIIITNSIIQLARGIYIYMTLTAKCNQLRY